MAALLAVVLIAGACGSGSPSPRASRSPAATTSPRASAGVVATLGPPPTEAPSLPPQQAPDWPDGWDAAFCTAFEEVVIAQELAVDIGRALAEENTADARALASELITTTESATALLGDVTGW